MKSKAQESLLLFPQESLAFLLCQASYRTGMSVTEVMVYQSAFLGRSGYYVCPRCHTTLEREFVAYCDRCGQHLDWKNYKKARVIFPGTKRKV